VTRVVSGATMLLLAVGLVWFAPSWLFVAGALILCGTASCEYASLARRCKLSVPAFGAGFAAVLTSAAFTLPVAHAAGRVPIDVVLMAAVVALASLVLAQWRDGADALATASAALFPALYIGLPVGAMIAIREARGREALALLMLTIVVSDTAQFYTGRLFGRRLLAPAISPKKTVAGAVGGFAGGALLLAVLGAWWLPVMPAALRIVLGAAIVALGITGDLFESMLKRSAGVKDSSSLIPGHGGVLDRIDALLFAAPVYYIVVRAV
jgi:phosphatidate cytidylyltransferase